MRAIDGDILEKKLKDAINMCVSIDTSGLSELKAVLEDVEEMPTIEPEPHWIPCSEKLPDKDGLYLVTTSKEQVQMRVFNHNGNSEEYWMRCNKAWMPLPEPWKGGQDDQGISN